MLGKRGNLLDFGGHSGRSWAKTLGDPVLAPTVVEMTIMRVCRVCSPAVSRALVVALVCLATCGAAPSDVRAPRPTEPAANQKAATTSQRQREGRALVDVEGTFSITGERATFYPLESQTGYTGLENLSLERITEIVADRQGQLVWVISGTITEFRGDNFLLISKAVLKSRQVASEASPSRGRDNPPAGGSSKTPPAAKPPK